MLIRFRLDKDGFVCTDASVVANAPTINYLKCRFDLKKYKAWKDVDAVTAIFKSPTYNVVAEVMLDSYNECYVDPEIYKHGGLIQCKLIGDKYVNGQIISSSHVSEIAEFYINENVIIPTPTPSKYDVFVAELERAEESVENVISELNRKVANGDFDGEDGTSISYVTFNSDGTVTVMLEDGRAYTSANSMKGEKGDRGEAGPGIANIAYGQDGTLTITLVDGTTFTSEYSMKGEQGERGESGEQGERGLSILHVGAMTISSYTDPEVPAIRYRRELSEIMSRARVDEVLVGDTIETAFTVTNSSTGVTANTVIHYHILKVDDTYAYFSLGTSLKGAKGDKGDTGAKGDTGDVSDVTVAGTSVVSNGVAEIPKASTSEWGAVKCALMATSQDSYAYTKVTYHSGDADMAATLATTALASTSKRGLMSYSDKNKLNGIEDGADVTTVTQTLTSGTEIGEVNGTKLYAPESSAIVDMVKTYIATIPNVPANSYASVDVPLSTFNVTDPDSIIILSCERYYGEFRTDYSAGEEVAGYSIRRDMGSNGYIRFIYKNNNNYERRDCLVQLRYIVL